MYGTARAADRIRRKRENERTLIRSFLEILLVQRSSNVAGVLRQLEFKGRSGLISRVLAIAGVQERSEPSRSSFSCLHGGEC